MSEICLSTPAINLADNVPTWLVTGVHQVFPEWLIQFLQPYGFKVLESPVWSFFVILIPIMCITYAIESHKDKKFIRYLETHPEEIVKIWQAGRTIMGQHQGMDRICVKTRDGNERVVAWYREAPIVEERLYRALREHRERVAMQRKSVAA